MSIRLRISAGFIATLLLASCAATPKINLSVAGIEMQLNQPAYVVISAVYSPDGMHALLGSIDETASLWDISTGSKIMKLGSAAFIPGGPHRCLPSFSHDGRYVLLRSNKQKTFQLWNVGSGKEIRTFSGRQSWVSAVAFSPDDKYALSGGYDKTLKLWEVETGKEVKEFSGHSGFGQMPVFLDYSPDGKYAVSASWDRKVRLWDISTGEEIRTFDSSANSVVFSPDGKSILSGGISGDNTVKLWDIFTGNELKTFRGHSKWITAAAFSPDGKYAISGSGDATLKLWEVSSGKEMKTFRGHMEGYTITNWVTPPGVLSATFSPDGKYIMSAGDASIRLWDVKTGKEIAVVFEFKDGEWLTITSDGYYNASEKGAQYLMVKLNDIGYTVDQFYDVFYRPDIVAAELRGEDIKDLITITMQDAIKAPPPLVEIAEPVQAGAMAKICYRVKSTGGGIGEVRLFHNGKLIQSDGYYRDMAKSSSEKQQILAMNSKMIYENMRSVSVKGKTENAPATTKLKGEVFEDCRDLEAVSGENDVSITAFNSGNTVQSSVRTVKFNSSRKSEDPHLYILSIGIDKYRDTAVNLKYAVKDATDIEQKLLQQSATVYKPQNIHYALLTDDKADKGNIISKINELSRIIKPQDGFILFVAGHGVLLQSQYYMLTSDYDGMVNDSSMISSNEIVEMSKKIKSLSQLFIFDTCHAGGVDSIVSGLYDARMSVLAKKMGLHIYASANSIQEAQDGYQGNGLFTYTLLDGLNNKKEVDKNSDNIISFAELGEYAKQTTGEISKKTGHSQTPLIINFGKDYPVYNLK
ncbi:MAG TPA: caspase family protein [Nitrospirota bacterium]|nr:caspase family protein [Nitrospirota bacterium]